jgi:NAD(P)-dependent dehydrogenase (short-subunit alcohol dehydrogenase family)
MSELDGRVIAIAGVGGGLGPLVAAELAAAGATVAGTDRHQEALDDVGASLGSGADRWDGRVVDLLDEAAVGGWCEALVERFGRVDGLVHLVGGWRGGQPLHEAPQEDWNLLHDLLIRTVQNTTRAFHAELERSGPLGRFVLGSAKQAAEAWTLAYADGFGPGGPTANIVVVEAILTPRMREESPGEAFPTFTPAEHLAKAIKFVCSDEAGTMNGQRLQLTMR